MDGAFTLRIARVEDLEAIAGIDVVLGLPQDDHVRAELATAVMQRRAVVCCSADGACCGYATWTMLWERHPFVQFVRVHPSQQRRGAGRASMEALIERFAAEGHQWIASSTDQVNTTALSFHAALGFERAGDVHFTDADDAEVMFRRRLP